MLQMSMSASRIQVYAPMVRLATTKEEDTTVHAL